MNDHLTVPVSPTVLSRLVAKANAEGVDIETLASRALTREAALPLIADILKPVQAAFTASGMTDDQLADLLEAEKHALRKVPHGGG